MSSNLKVNHLLWEIASQNKIELLGIADIREERKNFVALPERLLLKLPLAIVIGKRVSPTILSTLENGPNLIYYHHYRQLNLWLDQVAEKIAFRIEKEGYYALPIAASQIVNWEKQRGHVSHKKLAELAGLGFRGRNNLFITERWGAQVRLVSILTDFPLKSANPLEKDCGLCKRCLDICPAKAIKEEITNFDYISCYNKLREFSKSWGIGQNICGLCVKACSGLKADGRD